MKEIIRTTYLKRMFSWKDTEDIKVLSGVRRCGKSFILHQFADMLKEREPNANIIFLDLSNKEILNMANQKGLEELVKEHYKETFDNYLLIDEVQMSKGFEIDLNSLHSSRMFKIFVTASNAFLMSSKLKTLFTGRTMEIPVFPFSFKEYCSYFHLEPSDKSAMEGFLTMGGLPGSYAYDDYDSKMRYVSGVLDTIIHRDILGNHVLDNKSETEELFHFLADDIGNEVSAKRICEFMRKKEKGLNVKDVENHIATFKESYLFYEVKPFDLRGMRVFDGNSKYYLSDVSFRTARANTIFRDKGRILENVVALELMRRGGRLALGKIGNKEVDFVVIEGLGRRSYYQVSSDLRDDSTFQREVSSLLDIRDAYPKYILTNTGDKNVEDYNGIKIMDLSYWLYGNCLERERQEEMEM